MFAILMMFIIIKENGREAAGIYFSSKKPVSHHGGEKRAVNSLECCDAPDYGAMGQVAEGTNSRFASRLRLFGI
ncbi:hypothetical protein LWS67_03840 [Bacillus atrophaeus]|uniref:hypothetical protein n=1 Tax=Bacillus atrophaeus TaxID=1452 RepID=UPI001EFB94B5|nr:hypothetical protein [Bacillus atrophaeus]MCG8395769.1 hypothetical protein [Bacillus atrophaeus]